MKKYYRKQRLMGIALLLLSVFVAIMDNGNITVLLLMLIPSVEMIFTDKKIICDDNEDKKGKS